MVLESLTRLKGADTKFGTSDVQGKTLVFRDPGLAKGFAAVPRCVLRDPRLTPQEKTLYGLLIDYAWQDGQCFPGQNTLAHDMGLKLRQIIRILASLKRAKLITSKRPGMGKPNVYYIERLSKRYPRQIVDKAALG